MVQFQVSDIPIFQLMHTGQYIEVLVTYQFFFMVTIRVRVWYRGMKRLYIWCELWNFPAKNRKFTVQIYGLMHLSDT